MKQQYDVCLGILLISYFYVRISKKDWFDVVMAGAIGNQLLHARAKSLIFNF